MFADSSKRQSACPEVPASFICACSLIKQLEQTTLMLLMTKQSPVPVCRGNGYAGLLVCWTDLPPKRS